MSMAAVMSQMPDVWRRVLTEHVADPSGRCRACSATPGEAASWPCQTFKVAHHARGIATGEFPIPTLQPSLSRAHAPEPTPAAWPLEQSSRGRRWDLEDLGGPDRGAWDSEPSWPAPRREARRDPWDEGWSADWSQDAGREPRRDPWDEAPRTFDRSYGSTMDAPYGSSFGVDDRRRHSW